MASHKNRHICEVRRQRSPVIPAADAVCNDWVFLSFRSWESFAQVSPRWPRYCPSGWGYTTKGIVAMPAEEAEIHLKHVSVHKIWGHNQEKLLSYSDKRLMIKDLGKEQLRAYIDSIANEGNQEKPQ